MCGVVYRMWTYACDVHCVYVYVIKEKYWMLVGYGNQYDVCTKKTKSKGRSKDRLKDKYQCFVSVLIMHVIYDTYL